jgi:hypothetical protein
MVGGGGGGAARHSLRDPTYSTPSSGVPRNIHFILNLQGKSTHCSSFMTNIFLLLYRLRGNVRPNYVDLIVVPLDIGLG